MRRARRDEWVSASGALSECSERKLAQRFQHGLHGRDLILAVHLTEADLPLSVDQDDRPIGNAVRIEMLIERTDLAVRPEIRRRREGDTQHMGPGDQAVDIVGADGYDLSTQTMDLVDVPLE